MSPVSTGTAHKNYRYYTCGRASKTGHSNCPVRSVPAGDIEGTVVQQLRAIFRSPEMIAQTYQATRELEAEELEGLGAGKLEMEAQLVSERDVAESLRRLDPIWDELSPLEQSRIVQLLVERVTVNVDGMNIRVRGNGLHSLVAEVRGHVLSAAEGMAGQHDRSHVEC
jgi:hypothetical protein